ncbi:hypothetical protein OS493_011364 [Desmophyllum pertusum]|uniref:G-protein coupled receptors family 1 profile domain-containing protein n=1 Tax=Desmophyllum pertusum TaxID=174260 RepID=A0A9X0CS76_9CNID|nr:hypothetical protein OS493_011364 [Desmophyllum pertusum]
MPKSKSNSTYILDLFSSRATTPVVHRTKQYEETDIPGGIVYLKEEESFLRISFSIIVVCTIIGSFLVCAVNVKNRGMLKSPYNVNIFHLAITDLLVSIAILLTPGFIFQEIPIALEGRLSGEIFCRVISSHFLTFCTATTSIYITVALATERWYAVTRPLEYRAKFHTKRLVCEGFIIWALSLCANSVLPFEVKYNPEKSSAAERCEVIKIPLLYPGIHKLLGIAQFVFKFIIPFTINCNLYMKVLRETQKSHVLSRRVGVGMRRNISRYGSCFDAGVSLMLVAQSSVLRVFLVRPRATQHTRALYDYRHRVDQPLPKPVHFCIPLSTIQRWIRNLFCAENDREEKLMKHNKRLCRFRRFTLQSECSPENIRVPSSPI